MVKDVIGQELNIGDFISLIETRDRSISIGKITKFTPAGNIKYKQSNKSYETLCGSMKQWDGRKEITIPQCIKIIPTKHMDLYYENN